MKCHAAVVAVRVGFAFALLSAAFAASALTVEPLPGTTPQSTRELTFFPVDVGVLVRDDTGNPMPGVTVRFDVPFLDSAGYAFFPNNSNQAVTDANGVAVPQPNLVASNKDGAIAMTATALVSSMPVATFSLTVLPGPPRALVALSGDNQRARIGTTYPLPWVAQALGDDGLPVPYTLVQFFATLDGGTFPTSNSFFSKADANGIVTSPPFTASNNAGPYYGDASALSGLNDTDPFVFFHFTNLAVDDFVGRIGGPSMVAVGETTIAPFVATVSNSGVPVAGLPYRFAADTSCGRFVTGDPASAEGVTDSNGRASSPLYLGVARSVSCAVTLTAGDVPSVVDFSMHVFSYAAMVLSPQPASLVTTSGQPFRVVVSFAESGLSVDAWTIGAFVTQFNANRNGTSASITGVSYSGNSLALDFLANDKQGDYSITFLVGGGASQVTVPVSQRKR